ncbi:MAG: hypothetical protein LKF36_01810 [Lactobacillus sp.]|jgi:succinate-acetate transporter protein|nr:hypothetical protein [Lactobacillus sp.]
MKKENKYDTFQKRYSTFLGYAGFWIAISVLLDSNFFHITSPVVKVLFEVVVPVGLIGYLIYDYFKSNVKKSRSLIFLLVGEIILVLLAIKMLLA